MPAPPAVAAALGRAAITRINLIGLLVAHRIPVEELPLMLQLPGAVEHAVAEHVTAVAAVARLLAAEHGAEAWEALPTKEKLRWQRESFELIANLPIPYVPHASTSPHPHEPYAF